MIIATVISTIIASGIALDTPEDPAFQLAKGLVGHWTGVVGKEMQLDFRFTLEEGGKKLVTNGIIGVGTKNPIPLRSSLGWDPEAKKVYYLDEHGHDRVYFGHVSRDGDALVFDFKGLVGDPGHYRSRTLIEKDKYTSTMQVEQEGKWVDLGFHVALKRVK